MPEPACLYCGGTGSDPLIDGVEDRLRFVPGRWSFRRCRGCGSALLSPRPAPEQLPGFYPPVYDLTPELLRARGRFGRWISGVEHRLFFAPQHDAQVRRIRRATGLRSGGMLDVGCGGGLRLLAFRRRGFRAHGADFRPEVVDHLRRLDVPAVRADASALRGSFPDGSFELVTAFHVLEHVTDVDAALAGVFALLKPGGWFAGVVPLIDSAQARLLGRRWACVTDAPRHLSLPARAGIRAACERAGFRQVRLLPNSLLDCAGTFVLSLLPGIATTHRYRAGKLRALALAAASAALALLVAPWCLIENYLLKRPSVGMVVARKPG